MKLFLTNYDKVSARLQQFIGMIGMEKEKSLLLCEIKSILIRCLEMSQDNLQYDQVIQQLLNQLIKVLRVKEIAFFQFNEKKKQLYCKISTDKDKVQNKLDYIEICEAREEEIKNNDYFYRNFPLGVLEEYELIISLKRDQKVMGILAMKENEKNSLLPQDSSFYKALSNECSSLIQTVSNISRIAAEEKRYKQLFRVTEKFHSSMNMDEVLREIIHTLKEVFPDFTYYLLLSHDNNHHNDLPIKDLEYDSENIAAMQAYVTGSTQFEDVMTEQKSVLYAPLKGKQGVYGVLQVTSPCMMVFPKGEIKFITLLANTAGSAIENAQLYSQSKRLIADLQLINETSHQLNSNLRLTETITYMNRQISKSFNAEEIGFILYEDDGNVQILQGSSNFFKKQQAWTYIRYIKEKIIDRKESLFLGDLQLEGAESSAHRSVMAVPMVQSGVVKGFAVVMHSEAYYFSFEAFKLLQSLIHHSTLAFTNSILREELEKMVVTDHLTRLYSRSYLDKKLNESMNKEKEGTFILIDIDNFKKINDTYGHQVGDEILVQVSTIIQKNIRGTDIGARWGGEELAIYLPRVALSIGEAIAERIRTKVQLETVPQISISCGVSYWSNTQEDTAKDLFKRADTALYEAKNTGKNKVVLGLVN